MGYCAHIEMDIRLKDTSKETINKIKRHLKKNGEFTWDAISHIDPKFIHCDNDVILSGTYDDKYWETDWKNFLNYIAPYVKDDEIIECIGEDHSLWGFRFKDNTWQEVDGHIVYD